MFVTAGKRRAAVVLFFCLFAAWAVVALMLVRSLQDQANAPKQAEAQVPVVVFKQSAPANTILPADWVEVRSVPVSSRHPGAATALDQVVGLVTMRPAIAGEVVLLATVAAHGSGSGLALRVPRDMRAIAVSYSEVIGAGGLISPGDIVDVVAAFDQRIRGTYEAGYIVTEVQVLAVAQALSRSEQQSVPGAKIVQAQTVTLAVTPGDAERLALAETFGTLKLIVRSPGDTASPPVAPVTADDVYLNELPDSAGELPQTLDIRDVR